MAVGLAWLPITGYTCLISAIVICYAIAVSQHHTDPAFPTISVTGRQHPESCIFSQLFSASAAFGCLVFYARYKFLSNCLLETGSVHWTRTNRASLVIGFVAAFGVSLVGNFQTDTKITWIQWFHNVGAGLAFGLGTLYAWLQAALSLLPIVYVPADEFAPRPVTGRWLIGVRFGLSSLATVTVLMFAGLSYVAGKKFTGDDGAFWGQDDGGYAEHVTASASEWAVVLSVMTSILTLGVELRHVGPHALWMPDGRFHVMNAPAIVRQRDENNTPVNHGAVNDGFASEIATTATRRDVRRNGNIANNDDIVVNNNNNNASNIDDNTSGIPVGCDGDNVGDVITYV